MRQPWLWALLGVVGIVLLATGTVAGLVIVLPVVALFYVIRLTTEVREDGIYVRFAPFHRSFRRIPFADIERVERTTFGALTYGGLGIRWTPNTVAYMTKRGTGVKLHRANDKAIVIGSQDAETLAATIDEHV